MSEPLLDTAHRMRQKTANSYPSEVVRKSGEIHLTICAKAAPSDGHGREAGISSLISISSSKAPENAHAFRPNQRFFSFQETCFLSGKGWVTGIACRVTNVSVSRSMPTASRTKP